MGLQLGVGGRRFGTSELLMIAHAGRSQQHLSISRPGRASSPILGNPQRSTAPKQRMKTFRQDAGVAKAGG